MGKEKKAEEKSEIRNQKSEMEQGPGAGDQGSETSGMLTAAIGVMLEKYLQQVDPEIRKDNPVWHWALCDDHCTFVFRDGRKAVINF